MRVNVLRTIALLASLVFLWKAYEFISLSSTNRRSLAEPAHSLRDKQFQENCVKLRSGHCVFDVLDEYDNILEDKWPGRVDLFMRMFEGRGFQVRFVYYQCLS
jgi:hypothetical protein